MDYSDTMRTRAREVAGHMLDIVQRVLNQVYTKQFFVISHPEGRSDIRFWIGVPLKPLPIKHDELLYLRGFYWSNDFQTEVDKQFITLMQVHGWQVEPGEVDLPNRSSGLVNRFMDTIRVWMGLSLAKREPDHAMYSSIRFSLQEHAKGAVVQFPKR